MRPPNRVGGGGGWIWNTTVEVPGHAPVALFVELLSLVNLVQVLCWAGPSSDDARLFPGGPLAVIGVELFPHTSLAANPLEQLGQRCADAWRARVEDHISETLTSLPELVRATPVPS